jgi:mannobiose 2-epimerase
MNLAPVAQSIGIERIDHLSETIEQYLENHLLPFWLERSLDREAGGFLTHFDRDGRPTGETDKSLISQMRLIFSFSHAYRHGYCDNTCLEAARHGVDFVRRAFRDPEHGGWYWMTSRDGKPVNDSKILYGQSFAIYALSEFALATHDEEATTLAAQTFDTIQRNATETSAGGYWEMFYRDWRRKPGGQWGGDRKTLDVHMHLMEAFTTLYELTGDPVHQRKCGESIRTIMSRMITPPHNIALAQFDVDWNPLPAILFKDVWGADRDVEADARPLDNTNYGHNVELAWLLHQALHILDQDVEPYRPVLKVLYDHAVRYGLDREWGGIFVEGPADGPAIQQLKEFWQQAEALVGFLDATLFFC